jgi:hypothetical protein
MTLRKKVLFGCQTGHTLTKWKLLTKNRSNVGRNGNVVVIDIIFSLTIERKRKGMHLFDYEAERQ